MFICLLSEILRKHRKKDVAVDARISVKLAHVLFYAACFSPGLKLPCFLKQLLINCSQCVIVGQECHPLLLREL